MIFQSFSCMFKLTIEILTILWSPCSGAAPVAFCPGARRLGSGQVWYLKTLQCSIILLLVSTVMAGICQENCSMVFGWAWCQDALIHGYLWIFMVCTHLSYFVSIFYFIIIYYSLRMFKIFDWLALYLWIWFYSILLYLNMILPYSSIFYTYHYVSILLFSIQKLLDQCLQHLRS